MISLNEYGFDDGFVKCAHDTEWPDKYFIIIQEEKEEEEKCGNIRLIDFLVEATLLPGQTIKNSP